MWGLGEEDAASHSLEPGLARVAENRGQSLGKGLAESPRRVLCILRKQLGRAEQQVPPVLRVSAQRGPVPPLPRQTNHLCAAAPGDALDITSHWALLSLE